jgi:hypothetical protein
MPSLFHISIDKDHPLLKVSPAFMVSLIPKFIKEKYYHQTISGLKYEKFKVYKLVDILEDRR